MGPIDVAALRREHTVFLHSLVKELDAGAEETGAFIKNQVTNHSGFKHATGKLARATETKLIRTRRGNILRVKNPAKYALAQEHGSGTHAGRGRYIIRAKNGGALRFVKNGRVFVRRSVMHPGVPATHFLYRAVMSAESHEFRFLENRMSLLARRFSLQRV